MLLPAYDGAIRRCLRVHRLRRDNRQEVAASTVSADLGDPSRRPPAGVLGVGRFLEASRRLQLVGAGHIVNGGPDKLALGIAGHVIMEHDTVVA